MTTKDAALRLALEALEESRDDVATCLSDCRALAGIAFYEQQLIKHDAAIEGLKQTLAQQEPPNPWAEAVIEQLIVYHALQPKHDSDPVKAVHDLLCISNEIALDPRVSAPAQALIDRGRNEAQPAHDDYGSAKRLAESIYRKHYMEDAPHWKPLPDLAGVISQIDNMTTGLAKAQPALSDDELKALLRFNETCEDGEGYDVPKAMMQRLAVVGVVRRVTGNIYEATDFGRHVIEANCLGGAK